MIPEKKVYGRLRKLNLLNYIHMFVIVESLGFYSISSKYHLVITVICDVLLSMQA